MALKGAPFLPEEDARFHALEAIVGVAPASDPANLAGTLTGTTDGTLANVADIALSTSDTYTDSAVNTAINAVILDLNLQLKELQKKQNDLLDALRTAGVIA